MRKPASVTEYIAAAAPKSRKALREIRSAIRRAAPGITERISYRMPTFDLDGKYLLYMAAFTDHVSIYPATKSMMDRYGDRLRPYRSGAGTLRFDPGKRLPLRLITQIARLRVEERRAASAARRAKRTPAA